MLELDVEKRLGDFHLKSAFQAPDGITALFGVSGAGKTTLINMLAGLVSPERGRITVQGTVLFDSDQHINIRPWRRRIGYIFQDGRLFPHLTVRQNLLYGRRFNARPPAETRLIEMSDVTALLGIDHLLDRQPATLSGGEQQRVAIGRAVLASPTMLLMDEPLAALDAGRQDDIMSMIEQLRDQLRLPIVYVSHSLNEIARLADTIVVLSEGRVLASGGVTEVTSRLDVVPLALRDDGGAIITARVEAHDPRYRLTTLGFAGGSLRIPKINRAIGRNIRIVLRARDVAVALVRPQSISVQNILQGVVVEIGEARGPSVDLAVAVGSTRLIARITAQAADDLALAPGMPVFLLIKSVAFAGPKLED
jgi:molybdate transport system ATP-binding protein